MRVMDFQLGVDDVKLGVIMPRQRLQPLSSCIAVGGGVLRITAVVADDSYQTK